MSAPSAMCGVIFNEIVSFFSGDTLHVRNFVTELDAVKLVRVFEQLRSECGGNKLSVFAQFVNHVSYGLTMLSV